MISSNQSLISHREKYENNKACLIDVIGRSNNDTRTIMSNNYTNISTLEKHELIDNTGREWFEKINKDIDVIQKEQTRKLGRSNSIKNIPNSKKSTYSGKFTLYHS